MRTLNYAIDALYRAFAGVPKPHHIDGCPCCLEHKGISTLLGKPLRKLSASELSSYASSAFLTVGDVTDYLYFLPRVMEISATDPGWWPGVEVTGQAIRTADPPSWTAEQREGLSNFLESVIDVVIQPGRQFEIDSWLCAIARMGWDVKPFLAQVATSSEAVLEYFERNADTLPLRKLSNAFWELPCAGHEAIVSWFYSPDIAKIPFDAYGNAMLMLTN